MTEISVIYQVAVGEQSKLYDFCIASVERYAKRMGFQHIKQIQPKLNIRPSSNSGRSKEAVERLGYLPIFEKENAFEYFSERKKALNNVARVAIIDADIYIRDDCNEDIFEELNGNPFAAMPERNLDMTQQHERKLVTYSRMQYSKHKSLFNWENKIANFCNMGIMVFDKTLVEKDPLIVDPAAWLAQPKFKDFIDGVGNYKWSTDQTLLNVWLKQMNIEVSELNPRWNCLYGATSKEALKEAWGIHFYLKDKMPKRGEDIAMLERIIG